MARIRLSATAVVLSVLAVGGCSCSTQGSPTPGPSSSSSGSSVSPLTGLPGTGGPVLAVKIDNTGPGRPQTGLPSADLVYVEPVEGGETRVMAVFSAHVPDTAGPVRSARETDLSLLRQFGHPALAYSGAAPEVEALINAAPVTQATEGKTPAVFFRDGKRPAPYNLFLRATQFLSSAKDVSPVRDIGFRFGAAPAGGTDTASQTVRWPAFRLTFDWAAGENRWLASADGTPMKAGDGARLGPATAVVQYVQIVDSTVHDVAGAVSPIAKSVGEGKALVLRDGKSFDARWSRPGEDSGTTFTLADGSPMPFATGQVWIALTASP